MFFSDFPIVGSESRLPVYLTSIGLHDCQPHTVRKEGYLYPQFFYCTKGSGTLEYNGEKHIIKPYTAFFIPAGLSHQYYPNENIWDIRWIAPSGSSLDDMLIKLGFDKVTITENADVKLLEHFFRRMHESLLGDSLFGNYRASGYIYDFIIEFYRVNSSGQSHQRTNPIVIKAVDYIDLHYTEEITLDDLCRSADVSGQHMCRLFRSVLGTRPMEYIAKRRIKAAKELLTRTDMSIEDISEKTGFCSSSYFCKLFSRYEGMTPSQFRKG